MRDQDLGDVFLFKLEIAAKQFRKYKNRVFKEYNIDITSDQWILLKNISEVEGISQSELAERCKKEAAAVTRTLDILEKKKWVSRNADPTSRRSYQLTTTDKGRKIIQKILPIALDIRTQARQGITAKDLKILSTLLDRIHQNLE